MCCRYFVYHGGAEEIRGLLDPWEREVELITGEVRPSDKASVLLLERDRLCARPMRWGFLSPKGKGLLINARSETAAQKYSFADSFARRRCIIPAHRFYEWDAAKNKVGFTVPDRPLIFMAGLFKDFEDGRRFTVLTTGANASMAPVHDRMPLIFDAEQMDAWLRDDSAAADLLAVKPPEVLAQRDFEQLSLF
ncbi:MAG: SOS response-associated peptidase [Lachnospiraceae bacterium]|nr:SOS response-associated peptidase [Lachnospiraceae bacterium]